jgi:hypothetical protein
VEEAAFDEDRGFDHLRGGDPRADTGHDITRLDVAKVHFELQEPIEGVPEHCDFVDDLSGNFLAAVLNCGGHAAVLSRVLITPPECPCHFIVCRRMN